MLSVLKLVVKMLAVGSLAVVRLAVIRLAVVRLAVVIWQFASLFTANIIHANIILEQEGSGEEVHVHYELECQYYAAGVKNAADQVTEEQLPDRTLQVQLKSQCSSDAGFVEQMFCK